MASNGIHTALIEVERTPYAGKNIIRDPLSVADPEVLEIIKDVSFNLILSLEFICYV